MLYLLTIAQFRQRSKTKFSPLRDFEERDSSINNYYKRLSLCLKQRKTLSFSGF